MGLSDDDKQLAIRVSKVAQKVLDVTPLAKQPLRSTDIYEYLVTEGLFPLPKNDSTPFSRFLRKVKREGYLGLIPQIDSEDINPHFTCWYFTSYKPARKTRKKAEPVKYKSTEQFSYFENLLNTEPVKSIDVNELVSMIKMGVFRNEIEQLRKTDNKDIKKRSLGAVTTSGTFSKRNGESLIDHSGLIQIDFDDVENLDKFKSKVCDDPYTYVCFVSPRGKGLKLIVKIKPSSETHAVQFKALEDYYQKNYNIEIDPSCKDISRAMLLSYDPYIYWNEDSKRFEEEKEITKHSFSTRLLKNSSNSRNQAEYQDISIQVEELVQVIEQKKIDITEDYHDWCKIGFSLISHFGEDARDYFHRVSRYYPNYRVSATEKEFDSLIKNFRDNISIKTFFWMVKQQDIKL